MGKRYDALARRVARSPFARWPAVQVITRLDRWLLRLSNGRLCLAGGSQIGSQTLLLTCVGARSGLRRRVPLLFAWDVRNIVLLASRAGTDEHPHWYHNLKAQPHCQVSVGGTTAPFVAVEAFGAERERLWQLALEINPAYDAYARKTERTIPVMQLRPAPPQQLPTQP